MSYRPRSHRIGYLIAEKYPGIVEDYMAGYRQEQIARRYNVKRFYKLPSLKAAAEAVGYALRQLMPKEKYEFYVNDHKLRAQKKSGLKARRKKAGIFDPKKFTKKDRQKTGRDTAAQMQRERKGIFDPTYERTNKMQTLARGLVPWTDDRRDYFLELCGNPEYQHGYNYRNQHNDTDDPKKRVPDYYKIAVEMRKKFGIWTEPEDLRSNRYRFVKAQKKQDAKRAALFMHVDIESGQPFGASKETIAEISRDYGPEIVKRYKSGETQLDIAEDLNLPQIYGVELLKARGYVSEVVRELMEPEERSAARRGRKMRKSKKRGRGKALVTVKAKRYFFQIRTWPTYQREGRPDLEAISEEMTAKFPGIDWSPKFLEKVMEEAKKIQE